MLHRLGAVALSVIALGVLGCDHDDADDDVRPTIEAVDLHVGAGISGTVRGRYENTAAAAVTIQKPELQFVTASNEVGGIELTFPTGFDPSFAAGEVREATYGVHDDGVWTDFCNGAVELELHHQTVKADGLIVVSIGGPAEAHLECPTR
jgi:hypothetical protein